MTPAPKEQLSSVPSPSPGAEPLGIIIADDHVLFNDGIKMLLSADPRIRVLRQLFNGLEVETAVRSERPQLLLLDINLPGIDGLALSKRLKKEIPSLKILLLSMYSDRQFVQKAQAIGVEGYLLKSATQPELLDSIWAVMAGRQCFLADEGTARHAADEFVKKFKLTTREREIIQLIKEGRSSQEIADTIHLSVFTVETHRRNINLKLGTKNAAELVRKAIEIGL